MDDKGTEKLSGKGEKKPAKKPEKKGEKGKKKEGHGLVLTGIMTKPLKDGSFHHEHHMEDKNGLPHHQTFGYSSATKEDAAQHMIEHLPDAGVGEDEEPEQGDGADAVSNAGQPAESQAAAGGEEEE